MLAEKIEKEYASRYSDIDRAIFDQILAMDPTSSIEGDKIGWGAKQLLLPMYQNGETAFLDDAENVSKAIDIYGKNRGSYPVRLRNLATGPFPSVRDFVDYILNGDESEFAKTFDLSDTGETTVKENPIDVIYNKYYKDLPRETFDKIIEVDPETTNKSIGATARNFLLVKALKGEDVLSNNLIDLKDAIIKYNTEKDNYPKDKQSIQNFESVKDFMKYVIEGPETDFIKRLKNNDRGVPESEFNFIGSTSKYDIVQPLTHRANELIDRNVDDDIENFVWCTGWRGDTSQWRSHSGEWIYCFINKDKPSPTNQTDRKLSYQLSIYKADRGYPAYKVCQFLDGNDYAYNSHNASSETSTRFFRDFLNANPDVALLLSKTEHIKENDVVKEVVGNLKYLDKPFIYNGPDSLVEFNSLNVKNYCKELVIRNVENIPAGAFSEMPALRQVTFEEGLKEIGAEAFMKDLSLNNIVLPNSLERIDAEAFANCLALKNTIRIPDNLVYIGREAFRATGVTLSINKARTKKIQADPADRAWFASHAKAITVQEGLEENMNDELLEDVLDENIPPDLARAYANSSMYYAADQHPNSRHREIGDDDYRRNIKYDYYNSTYEELSKDQAIDYLSFNGYKIKKDAEGNPILDDNGKYQIAGRLSSEDRAVFNHNLPNLRFLVQGTNGKKQVVEFEVQPNTNILRPVYTATIANSAFGNYPKFSGTTDTSQLSKYSDFYTLIQISDKIYKTDEYEHEITSTTPTGKKVKLLRKDAQGNPVRDEEGHLIYDIVDDTIQAKRKRNAWNDDLFTMTPKRIRNSAGEWIDNPDFTAHNMAANLRTYKSPKQLDTGAHNVRKWSKNLEFTSSAPLFRTYYNAIEVAREAFKEYDYLRKYIKKVESQKEYYEEDDFNSLIADLNEKKQTLYNGYITAAETVKETKQKVISSIDDITLNYNKNFKSQIELATQILGDQYKISQKLADETLKVAAKDSDEVNVLKVQIKNKQDQIAREQESISELEQQQRNLLQQIEIIKQQVLRGGENIKVATEELANLLKDMSNLSDTVMEKKFEKIDSYKNDIKELQAKIDTLAPRAASDRAARAAKNKQKELDPKLVNIFDFGTAETETTGEAA